MKSESMIPFTAEELTAYINDENAFDSDEEQPKRNKKLERVKKAAQVKKQEAKR
jgi:hypothetical protein